MPTNSSLPLTAAQVTALQDRLLSGPGWPHTEPASTAVDATELGRWLAANHRNNSCLWAEEDLARRTTVPAAEIAANKRAIDGYNQLRNDATERIDELLLLALKLVDVASARSDAPAAQVPPGARLNSETAGSMVDRLSILALKVRAMQFQADRLDVDEQHRQASRGKLLRLQQQRADLAGCFDALLADAAAGRAYFKVYRQFKMYNDPRLNPQLVRELRAS
ncbi:MAG: DUF4254 domain-containing protein [Rubrivivax sp.]|nr:DUF4254 domain-containing protein [Rubrivivax sp.]